MNKIIYAIILLLLTACTTPEPEVIYKTKEVKIPIYQELEVPYRQMPKLYTDELTPESDNISVIKAYYLDHAILLNEINYFRSILYKGNRNEEN